MKQLGTRLFGEVCSAAMIRREAVAGLTTFMTMAYISARSRTPPG